MSSKTDAQIAQPIRVEDQYQLENSETVTVTTSSQTLDELLSTNLSDDSNKVVIVNKGGAEVFIDSGTATTSSGGLPDGMAMTFDKPDLSTLELIAAANTDVSVFVFKRMANV
jgi:hypothetical protein